MSAGTRETLFASLLERARREPIGVDISDFSDEWCLGFRAGQVNVIEEIAAGRLSIPVTESQMCRHGKLLRTQHCSECSLQFGYCDCPGCTEDA